MGKFKVGQIWETKSGDKVIVRGIQSASTYPVKCLALEAFVGYTERGERFEYEEGELCSFTLEGYILRSTTTSADLVRLVGGLIC